MILLKSRQQFLQLIYTLRYLQLIQIRFLIWYRLQRFFQRTFYYNYKPFISAEGYSVNIDNWIVKKSSFTDKHITFLNKQLEFDSIQKINWNYKRFGKLWTYNINYFDFLLQYDITPETGNYLINDFIEKLKSNQIALEPYPISLRGINWIKYFSRFKIQDSKFDHSLYAQYTILSSNIEYHLLGNHLLENGFSLFFAGIYFNDYSFYNKGSKILKKELQEQILDDGAHFELSIMYHQIILDRLLDVINLIQNNEVFPNQNKLLELFIEKASKMLVWLKKMTFQNGDIPHFNDSTDNIAPTTKQLTDYATSLNINFNFNLNLTSSGYRKFQRNNYECIVDVGPLGPDYIPGHAHADMMSFVLYANNKPLIVDTGISTYIKNNKRQLERSTSSHNTITVNGENQSDVWGGFRVGKRANIRIIKDAPTLVVAEHDGYKPVLHKRIFQFNHRSLRLEDILSRPNTFGQSYLHFHHDRHISITATGIIIDNKYTININNAVAVNLIDYKLPQGYNKYKKAKKVIIDFKGNLEQIINF